MATCRATWEDLSQICFLTTTHGQLLSSYKAFFADDAPFSYLCVKGYKVKKYMQLCRYHKQFKCIWKIHNCQQG